VKPKGGNPSLRRGGNENEKPIIISHRAQKECRENLF
jgi:hypothetical protein